MIKHFNWFHLWHVIQYMKCNYYNIKYILCFRQYKNKYSVFGIHSYPIRNTYSLTSAGSFFKTQSFIKYHLLNNNDRLLRYNFTILVLFRDMSNYRITINSKCNWNGIILAAYNNSYSFDFLQHFSCYISEEKGRVFVRKYV